MKRTLALSVLGLLFAVTIRPVLGQSLGNAGTIEGTVVDASGAAVAKAAITLHNALTNYTLITTSGPAGVSRLVNILPNPYHLDVAAPGFAPFAQDVDIRNALPVQVKAALAVAVERQSVTVEAKRDVLENTPSAQSMLSAR